jgi:RNA polymerase sigma factor (sigma-70 family)
VGAFITTFFACGEADLLERFRDGDQDALAAVYRAYFDSVRHAVSSALYRYGGVGGSGWRAVGTELPDLVQDVFTRAFEPRTRRRFDGVREYGPYLSQIARNVVVDHLRRKQRQVAVDATPLINQISLHPEQPEPANDFADFQTMTLVARYVADLPSDLRRVHEALNVQELSQREAAEALGLGRQAIRTLEARLREGLRQLLDEVDHQDIRPKVAAVAFSAQRKVE